MKENCKVTSDAAGHEWESICSSILKSVWYGVRREYSGAVGSVGSGHGSQLGKELISGRTLARGKPLDLAVKSC